MIVTEMIEQLQNLKPELQTKEIFVGIPKIIRLKPCIRFELNSPYDTWMKGDLTAETVKYVILTGIEEED